MQKSDFIIKERYINRRYIFRCSREGYTGFYIDRKYNYIYEQIEKLSKPEYCKEIYDLYDNIMFYKFDNLVKKNRYFKCDILIFIDLFEIIDLN